VYIFFILLQEHGMVSQQASARVARAQRKFQASLDRTIKPVGDTVIFTIVLPASVPISHLIDAAMVILSYHRLRRKLYVASNVTAITATPNANMRSSHSFAIWKHHTCCTINSCSIRDSHQDHWHLHCVYVT